MKRTRKTRFDGACVFTTAEEVSPREWVLEQPEVHYERGNEWRDGLGWGEYPTFPNHGTRFVRQQGNGSVRLVYPIPKSEGGGAFKPFAFPAHYPPMKSYPLDANGIDPRDKS